MWTSKIGNVARPLLLGLSQDDQLVNFSSLTGPGGTGAPQLRLRKPWEAPADAVSVTVVSYTDPNTPAQYNAQVIFSLAVFALLTPGVYIAEVDAHIAGSDISFPDDEFLLLRFLPSLN